MGKKSSPEPPDYEGAAQAQAQSSKEVTEQQTWANRPTQITPEGRVDWYNQPVWDPTTEQYINRWSQVQTLNPESQAAYDSQNRVRAGMSGLAENFIGRVGEDYSDNVNWDNFRPSGQAVAAGSYTPEQVTRDINFGEFDIDSTQRYADEAGDAIYERGAARLDPRFEAEESALQARLYNQGFREGDAAYDEEMRKFNQRRDSEYSNLMRDATIMAGQEASRYQGMDMGRRNLANQEAMQRGTFQNAAAQQALQQQLALGGQQFNEGMAASTYENQLRQQDIAEELQRRGWGLNEMNAILRGNQIGMPGMPGFNQANRSESAQLLSAADMGFQAEMDAFNADQAMLQSALQGGAQVGAMFSDRRLKKNVKQIGKRGDLPVYVFQYIWDEWAVGHMADEVKRERPDAVLRHPSGYDMVNYGVL